MSALADARAVAVWRVIRRLLGVLVFLIVVAPAATWAGLLIVPWAAHWLRTGEDDDSILLSPRLDWLMSLPGCAGGWNTP